MSKKGSVDFSHACISKIFLCLWASGQMSVFALFARMCASAGSLLLVGGSIAEIVLLMGGPKMALCAHPTKIAITAQEVNAPGS